MQRLRSTARSISKSADRLPKLAALAIAESLGDVLPIGDIKESQMRALADYSAP